MKLAILKPACLPLALALAGLGNVALAAGKTDFTDKIKIPEVAGYGDNAHSVDSALKGLQKSLDKRAKDFESTKDNAEETKDGKVTKPAGWHVRESGAKKAIKDNTDKLEGKITDEKTGKRDESGLRKKLEKLEKANKPVLPNPDDGKDGKFFDEKTSDPIDIAKCSEEDIACVKAKINDAEVKLKESQDALAAVNAEKAEHDKDVARVKVLEWLVGPEASEGPGGGGTYAVDETTEAKLKADAENALSGEIYASSHAVLLSDHRLRNVVQARMLGGNQPVLTANGGAPVGAHGLQQPTTRAWANAWGFDAKLSANRKGETLRHNGSGLAVGGDVRVSENVSAGVVLGVEDGKIRHDKTLHSRINVKSYSVGGYASAKTGGVTLSGGVIYSHLNLAATRDMDKVKVNANDAADNEVKLGNAKGNYTGRKVQAFAEVARAFEVGAASTVSPYANLTQTWLQTKAVKEKGSALFPLEVKAQNSSALQSTLGVRTSLQLAPAVALTANLGWAHSFTSATAKTSNRFTLGVDTEGKFAIKGQKLAKDRALVGVGIEAHVSKNATLAIAYDGQFGSHYQDHAGSLQFKLRF